MGKCLTASQCVNGMFAFTARQSGFVNGASRKSEAFSKVKTKQLLINSLGTHKLGSLWVVVVVEETV